MSSPARRPLPEAASAGRKTRVGHASTGGAAVATLTPSTMVALVNKGRMTVEAGDAVMKALAQPRLKVSRQATFGVRIAMQVPGDARPAAAIACLDAAVTQAVSHMVWSEAVDGSPDGYAIDPPSPTGPSTGPGSCTVHTFLRLTVSVAAYHVHRFPATARDLLHRDLQQLRQRGVRVGRARRWHLRDPDEDPWSIPDANEQDADIVDTDGDGTVDEPDATNDGEDFDAAGDLDPAHYIHVRLYDEGDLFDVDPFDPFHLDPIDTA